MNKKEKLRNLKKRLSVLYELQPQYGCRTLNNVIQNLEAEAKYIDKEG